MLQLHFSIMKDLGSLLWPNSLQKLEWLLQDGPHDEQGVTSVGKWHTHQVCNEMCVCTFIEHAEMEVRLRGENKLEERLIELVTLGTYFCTVVG